MKNKYCQKCRYKLIKWGYDARGKKRYRCPNCGVGKTRKRKDLTLLNRQKLFTLYLCGKLSMSEIAKSKNITRQTLNNHFSPFKDIDEIPIDINTQGEVLIVDGYYVEQKAIVLIGQKTNKVVVTWVFTYAENYLTWYTFFQNIRQTPLAVVGDGQKGMYKAFKARFNGVLFQRCQFHVIHHVNLILTKKPELIPSQELKIIVGKIIKVKTTEEQKEWLLEFRDWYKRHELFIKQKTYQSEMTATNRNKWHYTHGKLHRAFSHVKNALPYLFTYLKNPKIANTTNGIEGATNAQIQRQIDLHRGKNIGARRKLIGIILKQKQR